RRRRRARRRSLRVIDQNIQLTLPLIGAIGAALAVLIVALSAPNRPNVAVAVALLGLAVVAILTINANQNPGIAYNGAYKVDALTTFLDLLFVSIIALTLVFSPASLVPRGLPMAEFAVVLMFAMTGAMLIAASTDLLLLFLGLELMVLPGYMLDAYHKNDGYSTEGAIKYFLLGSFSSAIFLFGLAFIW